MKISELIKELKSQEDIFGDYEVFVSQDEEGNGFGTLSKETMWGYSNEDKAVILYPNENYLEYETICPKDNQRIINKLKEV
jgi:hypothetical protein